MHLSGVEKFLWVASFVANSLLLAVLLLRRRTASFPVFTVLIGSYIVRTGVLYSLALRFGIRSWPYFLTYWISEFTEEAIQLAVFYELVVRVFRPTGVWARDTRRAFQWLIAASFLLALALTLLASPPWVRWYQPYLLRSNFFISALMSELFVGTMALSATAGLPWKTHVARLAQGFGAYALLCAVLEAANNYFGLGNGKSAYTLVSSVEKFAYLGCACFWTVALWREAPAPRELPESVLMQIYTLQRRVETDLVRIRNWRQS